MQNINQTNVSKEIAEYEKASTRFIIGAITFAALGTVSMLSLKAIAITTSALSIIIPISTVAFILAIGFVVGAVICLTIAQEKRSIPPGQQSQQSVLDQVRHLKSKPENLKTFLLSGNPFKEMTRAEQICDYAESLIKTLHECDPEIQEHFKKCLLEKYQTFSNDPNKRCYILKTLVTYLPINRIDVETSLSNPFDNKWFSNNFYLLFRENIDVCCWYLENIQELNERVKFFIEYKIREIDYELEKGYSLDLGVERERLQAIINANTNIYPYLENISSNKYPTFKDQVFNQLENPLN